jgi:NADPH:quinone reductase-like Zn-dependent oxidoreductase
MTITKQRTMQAAALDRFGGIETITLQTLPVPEVGPDEVLIRVESAGVGSWDALEREGVYDGVFGIESKFPYVPACTSISTTATVANRPSPSSTTS